MASSAESTFIFPLCAMRLRTLMCDFSTIVESLRAWRNKHLTFSCNLNNAFGDILQSDQLAFVKANYSGLLAWVIYIISWTHFAL